MLYLVYIIILLIFALIYGRNISFSMKKIIKIIIISLFTIFSFYYTDKVIEFSKRQDPIMEKIKSFDKDISPVNAILSEKTMLVGQSGTKVDVNNSYEQMKKINDYNEKLLEFTSIKPSITMKDNLDKLIIGTNTKDKKISIVFNLEILNNLKEIVDIIKSQNVEVTLFLDGKLIEGNNLKSIISDNIRLGLYGYNNKYNEMSIRYMQNIIKTNYSYSNYCLYKNESFLRSCINQKINTVKPIEINNNLFTNLTKNKENGLIYLIKPTDNNIKELNSTLIYLKQKGYDILSLDDLLSE